MAIFVGQIRHALVAIVFVWSYIYSQAQRWCCAAIEYVQAHHDDGIWYVFVCGCFSWIFMRVLWPGWLKAIKRGHWRPCEMIIFIYDEDKYGNSSALIKQLIVCVLMCAFIFIFLLYMLSKHRVESMAIIIIIELMDIASMS